MKSLPRLNKCGLKTIKKSLPHKTYLASDSCLVSFGSFGIEKEAFGYMDWVGVVLLCWSRTCDTSMNFAF